MTKELEGKVVFVTGGGSGVGRSAALELVSLGATVTVAGRKEATLMCPGLVNTPLVADMVNENPSLHEHLVASHPLARIAEPQEIADAIVWLCPDKSSYVTGLALAVDGGYTAR
jgi:NAD(P)-dependent dehydrogenase (short-subunit alcohol dehydrogenase family)